MENQASSSAESELPESKNEQRLSKPLRYIVEKLSRCIKKDARWAYDEYGNFLELFNEYILKLNNKKYEKQVREKLLWTACERGSIKYLDFLLDFEDINPNTDGASLLSIAIEKKNNSILERLLKLPNLDVNAKNDRGETPLHDACFAGNLNALLMLLSRKEIEINCETCSGKTPLFYALLFAHPELVRVLLNQPGIRIEGTKEAIYKSLDRVEELYHNARFTHTKKIVEILHIIFFEKNIADKIGIDSQALFQLACKSKFPGVVEFMLKHTDVSANHVFSRSEKKLGRIFNLTALQCVLLTPEYRRTLCRHAMQIIEMLLLNKELDINITNGDGHSALFIACMKSVLYDKKDAVKNKPTKKLFIDVVIKLLNYPGIDLSPQGKNFPSILTFLNEKMAAEQTSSHELIAAKKIMVLLFIKGYVPPENEQNELYKNWLEYSASLPPHQLALKNSRDRAQCSVQTLNELSLFAIRRHSVNIPDFLPSAFLNAPEYLKNIFEDFLQKKGDWDQAVEESTGTGLFFWD